MECVKVVHHFLSFILKPFSFIHTKHWSRIKQFMATKKCREVSS